VSYLRACLLDAELLSLRCFELLPGAAEGVDGHTEAGEAGEAYMELDAAAMDNLEILQNSEGGVDGTLLKRLDHCVTGAGRRLLCRWLCRPLGHASAIRQRQTAVVTLRERCRDVAGAARRRLRSTPDLERSLSRLQAATTGTGRNASKVRQNNPRWIPVATLGRSVGTVVQGASKQPSLDTCCDPRAECGHGGGRGCCTKTTVASAYWTFWRRSRGCARWRRRRRSSTRWRSWRACRHAWRSWYGTLVSVTRPHTACSPALRVGIRVRLV
jgi:hypothetical protein